jgi:hypothetical protein
MDKILLEMEREAQIQPLNPVRRALWKLSRATHDLTGPGGLLPIHLGAKSLARERP